LALGAASSLLLSGCFGSFAATRALWSWNNDFGSKWVKWLVFLGLSILPVYGLFVLADTLVLNSLEFWTGSNPVASAPGGRTIARLPTHDPSTVRVEVRRGSELESVAYFRRQSDDWLQVHDEAGKLLADVRREPSGELALRDADGTVVARLSTEQQARTEAQIRAGQPALQALNTELHANGLELAGVDASSVL
jgi:hypothetical protein